jgi:predicted nucleic acid-binding protein
VLARLSDEERAAAFDRHLRVGTARTRHAEDATMAGTAAALGASFVTQNSRDLPRI